MIAWEQRPEGILLPVRAQAGARKNEIRGTHDGALKVAVTQVAEKGKANRAIVALLAKSLGLSKSQVRLVSGDTNSRKQFLLEGVSLAEVSERISPLV